MKLSFLEKTLPFQLSFLIFSMLLNCMGIVILKYSSENMAFSGLGVLEAFKDLPIALTSLLAVQWIGKTGQKKALLFSILLVMICCIVLPVLDAFWFFKIWFALIGISFAVAKISVFGLLRYNISGEKELSGVMSRVEAAFMAGIFCVNIGFGWLLTSIYADYWKFGFWLIAFLAFITAILLSKTNYKEESEKTKNIDASNFKSIFTSKIFPFYLIIFFIVFAEQSFNSWLPTFYKNNLGADSYFALQSAAFLAMLSFVGRMATSQLINQFPWSRYIHFCLFAIVLLLGFAQIFILNEFNGSGLMFIFPIVGLFLAPLYPLINSKLMIQAGKLNSNALVSAIVICSSLGSSIGSFCCSMLFQFGYSDFYPAYGCFPVIVILALLFIFRNFIFPNNGNN